MVNSLEYPIQEWKNSFEQAEIDGFRDEGRFSDWPLSQFMCNTVDTVEVASKDPFVMQGAINMLESEGFESFSPEFFITVLGTSNGETMDDFQELVTEWVRENMGPMEEGLPDPDQMASDGDWELWYLRNALRPTETYGATEDGGTLFWFDRGSIW